MSKNRDPESSLELLLDTMCNTFGGVMFIAIALMVVLSIVSKIDQPEDSMLNYEELQQKFEALKKNIADISSRNAIRLENIRIMQNDHRRTFIREIAVLEKTHSELTVKKQLVTAENLMLDQQLKELKKKKKDVESKLEKTESVLKELEIKNAADQIAIQNVQQKLERIINKHISFKTRQMTQKTPYFLIVYNDRIWRVGPDVMHRDPNRDVTFTKSGRDIVCKIAPDAAGVPILTNGVVSQEVRDLLDSIPSERAPHFSLHSNSLKSFSILREEMKKQNRQHGINNQYELENQFSYHYTSGKKDYEVF